MDIINQNYKSWIEKIEVRIKHKNDSIHEK